MAKVLLVEDELDLASLINNWLAREHHLVEVAHDGATALHKLKVAKYDVIILDVMLPGMNGFEVCRQYRQSRGATPILFLTAKSSLQDKELGFLAGADDYLTKPFHLKELEYRVKALLRRGSVAGSNTFQIGDVLVDSDQHKVLKDGVEVHLLPKEFRLLEFFVRHPQRVFSPEELLENVWESETSAHNDSVRGHITRLRKKLDTPGQPSIIATVYGVGYKLQSDDG
ncbi:MAG: response regulator transcription factor [Candidatus Obscuribacterales bacterium]|nr:response regulator transcription factor [Candidatus Obscuribacterales bacterium]